jgi:hypothetical protein
LTAKSWKARVDLAFAARTRQDTVNLPLNE